ncbi:oligosaccharide flippase family protein [Clostridium cuniculi]|uniref:oligosaccharide flippase family protein n=1 Tax=Clostridium cuniculi TaxID=2548455 RepID=UPI0018AC65D3|nr:oligosaccharide flippase family protein [Clostridium cuniculi]
MQLIKNFIYNVSYQLLTIILPLITVPYVSNILGAEGIGDYAFTNANMQYFVIFGMVGIALYGNREIAYVRNNEEKLRNTFYSIYTLQLITTTISLILYLIFTLVFNNGYYRWLYIVQGINIIASMVDISWLFMGLEEFKKTVFRNMLVKLISLASIFIFVKTSDDTIIYTIIIGLSSFIGNLTFWLYLPKNIVGKRIKVYGMKMHLKSSLSLFIPQIATQVYLLLDRTLLGILTDNIQVGYYDNSQKIVKVVLTIVTSIGTVMMPRIANTVVTGDMKKVKYYIKNSFFFVNAIAIPLMFGLMGIARELSPWFFTDKFKGIESLIIISSLIILAIGWSNVLGMQLLIPLNKTKEFTISVTMGAIINLILNLVMLKYFGAFGACISTIAAEFTVVLIQIYFIRKFINPFKLIKSILIFIPPAIIMYLVIIVIGSILGKGILTNIIQISIGSTFYILIVIVSFNRIKGMNIISYIQNIILK